MAKKLDINLQNLPTAAKIGIIAGIALIIGALSFFLLLKPKFAEIKKLKAEIVTQEKEIAKNEAKAAKLPEVKRRYAELEYNLKVLSAQLPEEKEVSDLLKQVSDYGTQSGLVTTLWKPRVKVIHASKIVYEIPVDVKMNGTYHSLGSFFSIVSGMDRIININDISLRRLSARDQGNRLDATFIAQTFSAIPEGEVQKPAPGKK